MRLTTWNVNGIRNPFGYAPWNAARTFPAMFDTLQADIVVMQELKIQRKDLRDDMVLLDGWDCYFSLPKHKKGYSGVAVYTRNAACAALRAEEGLLGVLTPPGSRTAYRDLEGIGGYPTEAQIHELGIDPQQLDAEGRCVCVEFAAFVLLGVYSPANSNGLRDDFRYGFICALDCRIRNLVAMGKNVVLVGDLNVSRAEVDSANAAKDIEKEGMTREAYMSAPNRRVFNQLVVGGEVVGPRDAGREAAVLHDVVRERHPLRKGMFTHWEQKINARPGNFGSRIDYVLVSDGLAGWVRDADIQEGLMGSDHCPVYADFKDGFMPLPEEWSIKTAPALSARLFPEFDRRRSIRDMFKASATGSASATVGRSPSTAAASATVSKSPSAAAAGPALARSPSITPAPPSTATTTIPPPSKRKISDPPDATPPRDAKLQKRSQQSLRGFFTATSAGQPSRSTPSPTPKATSAPWPPPKAASAQQTPRHPSTPAPPSPAMSAASLATTVENTQEEQEIIVERLRREHNTQPEDDDDEEEDDADEVQEQENDSGDDRARYQHHRLAAREDTRDKWAALLVRQPQAPRCSDHLEPCKLMLTRKKGGNQGRSFWMCARPLGPSGQEESGTEWRCGTFVWCR